MFQLLHCTNNQNSIVMNVWVLDVLKCYIYNIILVVIYS